METDRYYHLVFLPHKLAIMSEFRVIHLPITDLSEPISALYLGDRLIATGHPADLLVYQVNHRQESEEG